MLKPDEGDTYLEGGELLEEYNPYVLVEPEQEIEDELAALERIGPWDSGETTGSEKTAETVSDFPIVHNKQVEFYLDLFQNRQRAHFRRWLARSGTYLPYIQAELKKAGLPVDLAYLAMIESGFNPSAYSRAHAVGLWQFIRSTGRNHGLRIDYWIDERRNPEKATKAAISYLSSLYDEFGDWYLAVAAYNAGEGKIEKAIRRFKTRNFWKLARHRYLRLETKRYVPKLIAAILIARNPEKYGFTDIDYHKPVQYDHIEVPARTPLAAVAAAAGTSLKTIRMLNSELRRGTTPPKPARFDLRIPAGTYQTVAANLSRLHPVVTIRYRTHTVRKGDTLSRICRKYKLNKTTLLKANNVRSLALKPGQRLRIPYQTTTYVLLGEGETIDSRLADSGQQMILHRLQRGETLSELAARYHVPVRVLMEWNNIRNVRKIRAGDQLAIYLGPTASPTGQYSRNGESVADKSKKPIIILADTKKLPVSANEDSTSGQPIISYYKVKSGDSLWTIARKFQVSTREIRKWNNLRSNKIHPGKQLVIKKG